MTESMKEDAIRITKQAFIKFNGYSTKSRSSMAKYIRYQYEQLHQPAWQCILGKDYALGINSENGKRIILDVDKVAILIFKGTC
jgi:dynein light chain LC8-type